MSAPRIILSALSAERHGAAIRATAPDAVLIPVPPEGPLPDTTGATIAFSTRDLIEKGTRNVPAPEILRFVERGFRRFRCAAPNRLSGRLIRISGSSPTERFWVG